MTHRGLLVAGLLCSGMTAALALPAVQTVATREGRLLVNDRPFFPIGIYHAAHWHKGLAEAGAQGFNLVQTFGNSPAEFRQDVDEAFAHGMYSAVALNGLWDKPERVAEIVKACREAPGLLVWLLEDEPNCRLPEPQDKPYAERPFRIGPEKLQPITDLIKRLDPVHPVWLNLAHGFLSDHQAYQPVADIHSDDIYPVPEVPLPAVAAYADVVVKAAAGKVPWLVLQMSPVRPQMGDQDRAPDIVEARCMTYLALAHGCTGVAYYAFNERPGQDWRIPDSAPALWAQWRDLTAELAALGPQLLAPVAAGEVQVEVLEGPQDKGPWGYPALHVSLRQTPTGYLLLAVNGLGTPVRARLTLPASVATTAAVRFENRTVTLGGRSLEDAFGPYAVHVYDLPRGL